MPRSRRETAPSRARRPSTGAGSRHRRRARCASAAAPRLAPSAGRIRNSARPAHPPASAAACRRTPCRTRRTRSPRRCATSRSISTAVCVTLMWAEPAGSFSQVASRATAAKMQAPRVPGGGVQSSSGRARSRNGRSGATRSGRRVVAATGSPRSRKARKVAAPISESPPTRSHMGVRACSLQAEAMQCGRSVPLPLAGCGEGLGVGVRRKAYMAQ